MLLDAPSYEIDKGSAATDEKDEIALSEDNAKNVARYINNLMR